MQTIQASEFKSKCLALMDTVAATGETLMITKNGKPVAELRPYSGGLHKNQECHGDVTAPLEEGLWKAGYVEHESRQMRDIRAAMIGADAGDIATYIAGATSSKTSSSGISSFLASGSTSTYSSRSAMLR